MMRPRRNDRERGVALIAVLCLIALLTLLATTVTTMSAIQRRAVSRAEDRVQLEYEADSAIRVMLLRLIAPRPLHQKYVLNQPMRLTVFDSDVEIVMRRESGCIDLNRADEALLYAVFASNGWDEKGARQMAARIADWRDADDLVREGGAERAAYAAAGLKYSPRNAAFESVEELRQVLGGELIAPELMDAFTVYSHLNAPPAVFANIVAYRALAYAHARSLAGRSWLTVSERRERDAGPVWDETPSLDGEVIRVSACARRAMARACRVVYVRPTGNLQKPLQTFSWRAERFD
jgi:type II secretory pathway component PulK